MPCNSEHMKASTKEVLLSRTACLLDEFNGKKEIDAGHWRGYHPDVYNKSVDGDALVAKLCCSLQEVDVKNYSLEMQTWWRDHQLADKEREDRETLKQKTESQKSEALGKLTQADRKLLGV